MVIKNALAAMEQIHKSQAWKFGALEVLMDPTSKLAQSRKFDKA